jgi:hypothetical protein
MHPGRDDIKRMDIVAKHSNERQNILVTKMTLNDDLATDYLLVDPGSELFLAMKRREGESPSSNQLWSSPAAAEIGE